MRELNLTTAQFEHTVGVLSELDISPLVAAFGGGGALMDLLGVFPMLGQVREKKILRRLEAIWTATPDELKAAEEVESSMQALVARSSEKPVKETLAGLQDFFGGLGLSLIDSLGSSVLQEAIETTPMPQPRQEGVVVAISDSSLPPMPEGGMRLPESP